MLEFLYTVTVTPYTITPNFRIKQFIISNPTPFPIYIATSGFIPTRDRFDFMCQPNTNYVSTSIDAELLTIVSAGLELSKFVSSVRVFDTSDHNPAIVPQTTAQFVPTSNYPVTKSDLSSLPTILIDKFQNIFFTCGRNDNVANASPYILTVNGNRIGIFGQNGGVIAYAPTAIPTTLNPNLIGISGVSVPAPYTLNVFQTTDLIDYTFNPPLGLVGALAGGGTGTAYLSGIPPGIIFSLELQPVGAGVPDPHPYDVTVTLLVNEPFSGNYDYKLFEGRFTGSLGIVVTTRIFTIPPRIFLLSEYNGLKCLIKNNHATLDITGLIGCYPL